MKLLEILNMIDIKEHQQVWSISFFDKKARPRTKSSVNDKLVKELHKPVIKNFKKEEPRQYLKTISAQQI